MIFHKIVLQNLFAYKGEQVIDFMPSPKDTNKICLVLGRNGFGKTSLLRALKLLFLGTENKSLRQGLSRSSYILGQEPNWSGLLNKPARRAGQEVCSVRAELGPPEGVELIVERRFDLAGESFSEGDEVLEVHCDGRTFAGEQAEARLNEFLPRELVPFFLFDGEEIQELADATDVHRAEAMEQLLSLDFVSGVEKELDQLAKTWRRDSLPEDVQAEITSQEGLLSGAEAKMKAAKKRYSEYEGQLTEAREARDHIRHRLNVLRQGGAFAEVAGLDETISQISEDLQDKQNRLAHDLATDAPLLANPGLIASLVPELRAQLDQLGNASTSVVSALAETLPKQLFEQPPRPKPPLIDDQIEFLKKRLAKILDSYEVEDVPVATYLAGLDLGSVRALLEQFAGIEANAKTLREDRARRLREVSKLKTALEDMKAERREAEFGSSELAKQHAELEKELEETTQSIGRLDSELEKANQDITNRQNEIGEIEAKIRELEKQAGEAESSNRKLKLAVGLRDSLREYRKQRREAKRGQIEVALNEKYRLLMTGHQLIDRIEVDSDFYLRFRDKNGEDLGRSSVSHGMRQLAVTALLWALKDVSGRSLPVVVDTPLSRIDRDNQENLLNHYYPAAADQVIVLATDSEIDERKFEIIKPQLSRIFRLSNAEGEQAVIEHLPSKNLKKMDWSTVAYG